MIIKQLPNAAASTIAVTVASADLASLIATAGASPFPYDDSINCAILVPEDGDVRILIDGNTPTAADGLLLSSGSSYTFSGFSVLRAKLIRAGGSDVKVGVQVGQASSGDEPVVVSSGVSQVNIKAEDIEIGAVEIKNPTDDTRAVVGLDGLHVDVRKTALPSGAHNGTKTVTTAGVAVPIVAVTTPCFSVVIEALDSNAGFIYVGDSGVTSANGSALDAGESVTMDVENLLPIYLNASVSLDGVRFTYLS
jgi:hypothetical protein